MATTPFAEDESLELEALAARLVQRIPASLRQLAVDGAPAGT
jgi:hypothetical protein